MKGQAALEFLVTYGWMFIILLLAVAGLSYFGVLNPTNFVDARCNLDQIACPNFVLYETDPQVALELNLQNNFAQSIVVTGMSIKSSEGTTFCDANDITNLAGSTLSVSARTLAPAETLDVRFEFDDGNNCDLNTAQLQGLTGGKQKYDLRIYYLAGQATLDSSISGDLVTEALDYN